MKNYVQEGERLTLAVTAGAKSGDPVVVGQLPGVAENDADATTNKTVVNTEGVYTLSVKGIDGAGNAAIAIGDKLYFVAADTPKISKKNTGVEYGIALAVIAGGATATIPVRLKGN